MTVEILSTSEGTIPGELFSFSAMYPDHKDSHQDLIQVFKAISDPDTMYYHQVMKQRDKKEFIKVMEREMNENLANDNFELVHKSTVPPPCNHTSICLVDASQATHQKWSNQEIQGSH